LTQLPFLSGKVLEKCTEISTSNCYTTDEICTGSQYYRYTRKLGVHADYPKRLSLWRGLPTEYTINAAFQAANSVTYFFAGQQFYRFNDIAFNVRKQFKTLYVFDTFTPFRNVVFNSIIELM